MGTTVEPPEHRACRLRTTRERRGVEEALQQWRLGDSNRVNVYVGTRHVGTLFDPAYAEGIVAAMNAAGNGPHLDAAATEPVTGTHGHSSGSEAPSAASLDANTTPGERARETGPDHATITP